MAIEQTEGRGQRGATWQSLSGKNLTASFLYSPTQLKLNAQFALTIISSLSLYDITKQFVKEKVSIKWPNDIYVNDKKIAGILIENKISSSYVKHAIIGIGLNVFQTEFSTEIKHKTTSLSLENFENNVTILDLVRLLQEQLKYYALLLENDQADALLQLYNQRLYKKDISTSFIVNDKMLSGIIRTVEMDGLLQVEINQQIQKFDLKEITFCI